MRGNEDGGETKKIKKKWRIQQRVNDKITSWWIKLNVRVILEKKPLEEWRIWNKWSPKRQKTIKSNSKKGKWSGVNLRAIPYKVTTSLWSQVHNSHSRLTSVLGFPPISSSFTNKLGFNFKVESIFSKVLLPLSSLMLRIWMFSSHAN